LCNEVIKHIWPQYYILCNEVIKHSWPQYYILCNEVIKHTWPQYYILCFITQYTVLGSGVFDYFITQYIVLGSGVFDYFITQYIVLGSDVFDYFITRVDPQTFNIITVTMQNCFFLLITKINNCNYFNLHLSKIKLALGCISNNIYAFHVCIMTKFPLLHHQVNIYRKDR
jgi:hypothetical protein